MIDSFQIKAVPEKKMQVSEFITGYWENDIWNKDDHAFDTLRPPKWSARYKKINFSSFPPLLKKEIKYMILTRVLKKVIALNTIFNYATPIQNLADFLRIYYPSKLSFIDIPYEKALMQWRTYLVNKGLEVNKEGELKRKNYYNAIFNQVFSFFFDFYDTREETEKDIWDLRKIPGAKITQTSSDYVLNFTEIPMPFRNLIKRYLKFRISFVSRGTGATDIISLNMFLKFINKRYPIWKDLKDLSRKDMEDYFFWYRGYTKDLNYMHYTYLARLKTFLETIQRNQYPESPILSSFFLFFPEDMPNFPQQPENNIKYIPEGVIQQLDEKLEYLTPAKHIPVVILLRATGWRISDILNLKYNTCLERTSQGWYLCGDIPKTQVRNHKVPILDEVAAVVELVRENVKKASTPYNNPNNLLFVHFDGKRKGRCPKGEEIGVALNRLAQKQNIVDDQGNIFHFRNHAFRHTKGVELINNGMNLLHVQKWLAHVSPEMTLRYAKILDTSMRKSWEEAIKHGLFMINESGKPAKIDISAIQNEDIIEWEYIRSNLDAVRMPLGFCMKPKKQECHTQLNPCLTCRNLCTTPDFIPQYELEIRETRTMIKRGKAQGRSIWVEKNEALLERYEAMLIVLKDGKIHHKAGKKGRENVGEERNNAK